MAQATPATGKRDRDLGDLPTGDFPAWELSVILLDGFRGTGFLKYST